jgi:hypothetical protein
MKKQPMRETVIRPSRSNSVHAELINDEHSFLWIGDLHGHHLATIIGADALHALATAIQRRVPKPPRVGRPPKKVR